MNTSVNLLSLEQQAGNWWKVLDSRIKLTFFSALIFGFLSHGMVLMRKFSAHDDVAFTHVVGVTVESGRWMLELISRLEKFLTQSSHFSMPLFNGLLSLLCIALSAALLVWLLEVRSRTLCIALGGIFTAVPVMASLFAFMFTAPYYMVALLMTVVAACLICRGRSLWSYGGAIMLLAASMGIYQGYIPVTIGTMLLHFLLELTQRQQADLTKTLRTAVRYGFAICAGVLLYYIINKGFLALFSTQLNSYQGINKMGREGIAVYLSRVMLAYRAFFLPESLTGSSSIVVMGLTVPYRLLLLWGGILLGALILDAFRRSPLLALQMAAVGALMPLAVAFIYVMCPDVHALMVYGQCVFFLAAACLADRLCRDRRLLIRLVCILCCVVLLWFCLIWCRYDNALYTQITFNQERATNYLNTLVTRIKATEGYRDGLPVAYINWMEKQDQTLSPLPVFPYIWPYEDATDLVVDAASLQYMDKWCGFYAEMVTFDHPDIASMPCYPDDGSIRIIEDVIVVKFR